MMYRRDPILSSSPPPVPHTRSDSEDDLVTQPTQPLPTTRSPFFAAAAPTQTQPTLLLTPKTKRVQNPTQVLVARSSPAADRQSSPAMASRSSQAQRPVAFANPMAPPGTSFFPPQAVPRPRPIDLTSDDPPVEPDSEEEESERRSNIPISKIERSGIHSRIEETPQKPSWDLSSFSYGGSPKKRAADSYPDTPPREKKTKLIPKQSGPARAMPVSIDLTDEEPMTLADIPDIDLKRKTERIKAIFVERSIQQLYEALIKNKGHFDDTCSYLADLSSEDELLRTPPHTAVFKSKPEPVRKTAQRGLNQPVMSLSEKYSKLPKSTALAASVSPEKPKPKRRLMRGRKNRSPTPESSPPRPQQKPQEKPKATVISDDEDEGITIVSDDSDSEAQASEAEDFDDASLLEFFNTCSVEAMVDLSGHKEGDIKYILDKRPFLTLAAVERLHPEAAQPEKGKKSRRPKVPFGQRLVESAKDMWDAYAAIDQVVKDCEELGRPMVSGMARWGIDIFGTSTDGEVAATSLDDSDASSTRDSGYHTPHSSNGSDEETGIIRKAAKRASSNKIKLLKKPSIMNDDIELKDYQVVGLNWLNLLWQNGISGILADDMGLGKTCQVISFLSHLKEQNAKGPHLVIVPGSTLENWCREFEHFSKTISYTPYYGSQAERYNLQDTIQDAISSQAIDVIITTYDLAFRKEDNSFLRKCKPQACIFDEGHVLKNANTQRYKMLMRIDSAKCRILLTGTPLQNSLQELTSILAFLMPQVFSDDRIKDALPIVFKTKAKVNEVDSHGTLLSTQRIKRARSMLTPFILRRKKAQVLKHLPKKTCRVEYCELTKTQKTLYDEQLQKQRQVLLDRAAGIHTKEHANVMMKLRQAAIHPLLFRHRYNDDKIRKLSKACLREDTFENSNPDIIYEELQLYQDYQCHQLALKYPRALSKFELKNHEWMDSGKVTKLMELLKKFKKNGDRALVFSQFTSVMDILQWVFDDHDIGYIRLDGSTPIKERQELLDQFYEDESIPVFMLSTKSGGAGINLACANKVIIFDSSFNPQDDIQAENRAHRVGQTREVEVVRLVTKGTVEEQIHALGVSKLELDKMVQGEEGADGAETKKKADKNGGDKMSKAEEMGLEAVEQMMMEELGKGKDGAGDVKDQFMVGLKKAGLDLSAA